jgi:arabinose-5-phosphate isomerase
MSRKKNQSEIDSTQLAAIEDGRAILRAEAEAILTLSDSLDESFRSAVQLILDMPREGRVIVSGMGKAGFIGMKISATLASTGLPSFFLHPAEAVHGDLGRYTKCDVALILSNSGETYEVLRVLPHVKRMGCSTIAITGSVDSSLGRHSDVTLSIGKIVEAGPLGVAPTTSTTLMLALGDALAMAVLKNRGLTHEEFAALHPAGNIGRLLMVVSDIMRRGDENCVAPTSATVRDVIHRITITKGRPGAAAIVDPDGTLVGVFTDGNLRRCLDERLDFLDKPVEHFMSKNPKSVRPEQLVQEALRVMTEHRIDQVIVVDAAGAPIGMIDIQDVSRLT